MVDGVDFQSLFSSVCPPTVIFCTDDNLAAIFYRWAEQHHLHIPQDLSIASSLDLERAATMDPALTTFRFSPEDIGCVAVREVVERCYTPARLARHLTIPGELIERQSVRPVPAADALGPDGAQGNKH
jgi:DNA-binding LacI/PurR family transcriptional regulator